MQPRARVRPAEAPLTFFLNSPRHGTTTPPPSPTTSLPSRVGVGFVFEVFEFVWVLVEDSCVNVLRVYVPILRSRRPTSCYLSSGASECTSVRNIVRFALGRCSPTIAAR